MSKSLVRKLSIAAGLVLVMGSNVYAADGAEVYTAKGCAGCHGADAKTPIMGAYPKIAGQNLDYLIQQLKDIKSGARNNGQSAAMQGIMSAVNEDEIKAVSTYLSGL
jgi:cytochrome c